MFFHYLTQSVTIDETRYDMIALLKGDVNYKKFWLQQNIQLNE